MRLMVLATRQAFVALRSAGNTEIPANLRFLYRLPNEFVVAVPAADPRQSSRRALVRRAQPRCP